MPTPEHASGFPFENVREDLRIIPASPELLHADYEARRKSPEFAEQILSPELAQPENFAEKPQADKLEIEYVSHNRSSDNRPSRQTDFPKKENKIGKLAKNIIRGVGNVAYVAVAIPVAATVGVVGLAAIVAAGPVIGAAEAVFDIPNLFLPVNLAPPLHWTSSIKRLGWDAVFAGAGAVAGTFVFPGVGTGLGAAAGVGIHRALSGLWQSALIPLVWLRAHAPD